MPFPIPALLAAAVIVILVALSERGPWRPRD